MTGLELKLTVWANPEDREWTIHSFRNESQHLRVELNWLRAAWRNLGRMIHLLQDKDPVKQQFGLQFEQSYTTLQQSNRLRVPVRV